MIICLSLYLSIANDERRDESGNFVGLVRKAKRWILHNKQIGYNPLTVQTVYITRYNNRSSSTVASLLHWFPSISIIYDFSRSSNRDNSMYIYIYIHSIERLEINTRTEIPSNPWKQRRRRKKKKYRGIKETGCCVAFDLGLVKKTTSAKKKKRRKRDFAIARRKIAKRKRGEMEAMRHVEEN